jgi:hypothetical protein
MDTNTIKPRRPTTAQAYTPPTRNGETVFVGLKLASGLVLEAFEEYEVNTPTPMGFMKEKLNRRTGERCILKGNSANAALQKSGYLLESGGFAITAGVPKDLFEHWCVQNKESGLVTEGLIFSADSYEDAAQEGHNRMAIRSGLEPIDPNNVGLTVPGRKRRINGMGSVSPMESYGSPSQEEARA